jgi:serine O-acetyltransferase
MKKLRLDIINWLAYIGLQIFALISCFNPRLLPAVLFLASGFCDKYNLSLVGKAFISMNLILFGIETSPKIKIGGGLFLPHTMGTLLGAESIGKNVTIMHGVTLGAEEFDFHFTNFSRPVVGNNVFIGAGER